jgi:PAS domain-containing protein
MMATTVDDLKDRAILRSRAVAQLKGPGAKPDASAALGVLYDLASSPVTAPGALALLHELQVHQVEVDIQDEELRRSRVELEASLYRQVQLYDHAPVGQLTLDEQGAIQEMNQTAAALFGCDCDTLRGRSLAGLLSPESAATLGAMLGSLTAAAPAAFADLQLRSTENAESRCMHASACLDPAGDGYLIGMMGKPGTKSVPAVKPPAAADR